MPTGVPRQQPVREYHVRVRVRVSAYVSVKIRISVKVTGSVRVRKRVRARVGGGACQQACLANKQCESITYALGLALAPPSLAPHSPLTHLSLSPLSLSLSFSFSLSLSFSLSISFLSYTHTHTHTNAGSSEADLRPSPTPPPQVLQERLVQPLQHAVHEHQEKERCHRHEGGYAYRKAQAQTFWQIR